MPLPKLETTKYKTKIPSTGKTIEYRPFLVKEEKILLIAQESEDSKTILSAIKDIIRSCTFEKVDVDELASYDLEYIFLQLRSKSVGEIIDLRSNCGECQHINQLQVDLEKIEIKKPEKEVSNTVQLNDSIGITLRPVPVKDIDKVSDDSNDLTKIVSLVIETIFDDNNVYKTSDVSQSEMNEFVDSLSHKQMMMIEEFISSQPSVYYKGSYTCHNCGKENKFELEGLNSFFE